MSNFYKCPILIVFHLAYIRFKIKPDSISCALKCCAEDDQNEKNKVRKCSCNVDDFSNRLNSLAETSTDEEPSEKVATDQITKNGTVVSEAVQAATVGEVVFHLKNSSALKKLVKFWSILC